MANGIESGNFVRCNCAQNNSPLSIFRDGILEEFVQEYLRIMAFIYLGAFTIKDIHTSLNSNPLLPYMVLNKLFGLKDIMNRMETPTLSKLHCQFVRIAFDEHFHSALKYLRITPLEFSSKRCESIYIVEHRIQ